MASDLTFHRLKYSSLAWVALGFGIFAAVGFYSARMTNDYPGYNAGRAAQRKITLESLDLVIARRPDVHVYSELLVQDP